MSCKRVFKKLTHFTHNTQLIVKVFRHAIWKKGIVFLKQNILDSMSKIEKINKYYVLLWQHTELFYFNKILSLKRERKNNI